MCGLETRPRQTALDPLFSPLRVGHRDLAAVDLGHHLLRVHVVDGAADRLRRAEHLLAGAREGLGAAAGAHHAGDLDDVVHGDVAVVLDVLLLWVEFGWFVILGVDGVVGDGV